MDERTMLRWGGLMSIMGGVLAIAVNLLHPRFGSYEVGELLTEVPEHDNWIGVHLGLALAAILLAVGLSTFTRSLSEGRASAIAELARPTLLIGAGIGVVTGALDGPALRAAAVAWVAAGSDVADPLFAAGGTIVEASNALFSLFVVVFLGLAPLAVASAASRSSDYPRWLGWGLAVGGAGGLVAGLVQSYRGLTSGTVLAVTIFSGFLTLMIIASGVLMWRRSASFPAPNQA